MLSLIVWHGHPGYRRLRRFWRELDGFAAIDARSARADLSLRLLKQIRHFGNRADALPEWREAAKINDPADVWRVWRELPILTKEDLRGRFSPHEMRKRCGVEGLVSATGGSTGEPTPFVHDRRMRQACDAVRLHCIYRMGWRPGMPNICVWGSERDIGRARTWKSRVNGLIWKQQLVDGYRLDGTTVDRVLGLIRRYRSVALHGFTSMLEFIAREVLARGDTAPRGRVRAAWNGGEMLLDEQSRVFQQAFGVPLCNVYGGRELSTMAFQARPAASSLTVLRPLSLVEIVDEQGRPVGPGATGRLIWTSTICRGTPFLRYDVGDLGAASAADQDESGIVRLTSLHGRSAGLLNLPGGKTISALFWNHLFKDFPEVRQFQVALKSAGDIELRLKGRPFTLERERQLRTLLFDFLGPLRVGLRWMDAIPLTGQGKLLQVVREAA